MAEEIIRNGVTYRTAHTYKFTDGEISESYDGGEISESEVDDIINCEKSDAEIDAQDKEFAKIDAEEAAAQKINTKSKSRSKNKKGSI